MNKFTYGDTVVVRKVEQNGNKITIWVGEYKRFLRDENAHLILTTDGEISFSEPVVIIRSEDISPYDKPPRFLVGDWVGYATTLGSADWQVHRARINGHYWDSERKYWCVVIGTKSESLVVPEYVVEPLGDYTYRMVTVDDGNGMMCMTEKVEDGELE